ncbi:hypothetical protein ACHHYP_08159 [Achlya hypogyna]|uniref:TIR domain-containing protein n=1 Tax=Achlya hypogyna TaxID=1202772 RepID=A0A1V9ZLC3_ACHHY|nr:hypothetical protein ACHHYP_08159 [Achlya hypogyna]
MGTGASAMTTLPVQGSVLFLVHSSQEAAVRAKLATLGHPDCLILTELYPQDLLARYEVLMQCDTAIVLMDCYFHFSDMLLTSLSFLKDARKALVGSPLEAYFAPSGALGAICFGYGTWIDASFLDSQGGPVSYPSARVLPSSTLSSIGQPAGKFASPVAETFEHDVAILYEGATGRLVAEYLVALQSQGLVMPASRVLVDHESLDAVAVVTRSKLVVCIVTESSAAAVPYRTVIEVALVAKKVLLPINSCVSGGLPAWLGLAFAGRLWYPLPSDNLERIHKPYAQVEGSACCVADACEATDLLGHIASALVDECHLYTAEDTRLQAYEAAVLADRQARAMAAGIATPPSIHSHEPWVWTPEAPTTIPDVAALLPTASSSTGELTIHETVYTLTRLTFEPPPAVVDGHGLPRLDVQLDAMFSYAWKQQAAVLQLYQQGRVANLCVWMDVMGYMKGNIYAAMATAVQSVGCLVVFLSAAYVTSINCRLEFAYAVHCRKALLFVIFDDVDTTQLPEWITTAIGITTLPVHPATAANVFAVKHDHPGAQGILFSAIRSLAARHAAAAPPVCRDGSAHLARATSTFRDALSAPRPAGAHCSRCGTSFNPAAPSRTCRNHSGYYMGGSLLAGRWVCCNEPKPDGPGCQAADHIEASRTWLRDESYGTFTWSPA